MQPGLVGLDDDTSDDERSASEFKEIVGSTHLVHLENLGEDVAEGFLRIVGRSHESRSDGKLRLRQSLYIGLAIRRHGHLGQLQISRRHHILREALGDLGLQGVGRNLMVGRVVGTEVFLVVQLADHDDHLLHPFHREHHILDFAEFDTQTTQFDLVVGTSKDNYVAIREPFRIVARPIDPFAVVVDEAFTGHLIEVVIAASHPSASNIKLAYHTGRQFVAIGIDDKLPDVQLRLTHSRRLCIREFGVVRGNGNLRWAIAVKDAGLGDATHLQEERIAEFLATGTTDVHLRDGLAEIVAREPGLPTGRST